MSDEPFLNVVPLREAPALTDIVAQLRRIAGDIESGEIGDVTACYVLLPIADCYPRMYGFGRVDGENDVRIQLDLAKFRMLKNIVKREA